MKNVNLKLILLFVATAFLACKTPKKANQATQNSTTNTVIENPTRPIPPPIITENPLAQYANYSIFWSKTGCYGKCPIFEFQLEKSGKAYFTGKQHVFSTGNYVCEVSQNWFSDLQNEAKLLGFESLAANYPLNGKTISDFPTSTIYIKLPQKEKRVISNYDAPQIFTDFENLLYEKLQKLPWRVK